MDKKIGRPLGQPDNIGKGQADPQEAGAEGGSAFLGDQRQKPERTSDASRNEEPPLDGTISSDDIEGDTDDLHPGASHRSRNNARLSMTERKKHPLIIW